MKQEYLTPKIKVVVLNEQDAITTSTPLDFMSGVQSEDGGQYFEDFFG